MFVAVDTIGYAACGGLRVHPNQSLSARKHPLLLLLLLLLPFL